MSQDRAKRVCCLLLLGFAVGCGTKDEMPSVELASQPAQESAAPSAPASESSELESSRVSETSSIQAQMPELVLQLPAVSAIDAEVQPAALGLPAMESVSLGSNSNPPGSNAFSELVEAYRAGQPDRWARAEAAIHAQGSAALAALLEGLSSPEKETRELASMMLAQVLPNLLYAESLSQRPDVLLLAGKLRQSLQDPSAEVRVNVAVALSMIEGEGPALVPVLQELLGSELPHVRTMAVSALGNLGPPAKAAIGAIERLSQSDSDPTTKAAALEALTQLRSLQ